MSENPDGAVDGTICAWSRLLLVYSIVSVIMIQPVLFTFPPLKYIQFSSLVTQTRGGLGHRMIYRHT